MAIIFNKDLSIRKKFKSANAELVAINLVLDDMSELCCCCFYRPPNLVASSNQSFFDELYDVSSSCDFFVASGDINIDFKTLHSKPDSLNRLCGNFLSSSGLSQLVNSPTNKLKTRCIDWVLSNKPHFIKNVSCLPAFLPTDHSAISFTLEIYSEPFKKQKHFPDYSKANFKDMNNFLYSVNWDKEFTGHQNISELYKHFCSIVLYAISIYVPSVFVASQQQKYPSHITRLCKHRDNLFAKSHLPSVRKLYSEICVSISGKIRRWERNKQKRFLSSKGKKGLYQKIKQLTKSKSSSSHLVYNNIAYFGNKERADILAKTFASVYSSNKTKPVNNEFFAKPCFNENLPNVVFLPYEVCKILKKLKASRSMTSDTIPQIVFKKCASSLALPLSHIFNISMLDSVIPDQWKISLVTPIPKPNKLSTDPNSYRPISILCTPLKVMERVMKSKLMPFLERNKILPNQQFGFRSNSGVVDQLLDCNEDWNAALENGKNVDIIYFDFSKAFDKVPTDILLKKCYSAGISDNLLRWLSCYLENRTFSVNMNNHFSEFFGIPSGVTQGSVLGPVLFLLYISDLPRNIQPYHDLHVKIFADDLKFYIIFDSNDREHKQKNLQSTIDCLEQYAATFGLEISQEKCQTLHLGKHNPKHIYTISGNQIKNVDQARDLGVQINSCLQTKVNVTLRASKAMKTMFQLLRIIKVNDPYLLVHCYKTYVLPIIEFASQVWSPYLKCEIETLEKIQKLFTKIVYKRANLDSESYEKRCELLNLQQLSTRRKAADLVTAFKIIKGHSKLLRFSKFFQLRFGFGRRAATTRFNIRKTKTEYRRHSFSVRCSRWLNKLPPALLELSSVKKFKEKLQEIDLNSLD